MSGAGLIERGRPESSPSIETEKHAVDVTLRLTSAQTGTVSDDKVARMLALRALLLVVVVGFGWGCGATPSAPKPLVVDDGAEIAAINGVIDDWHAAAKAADEARYFGHLTDDAVFLGTDATERWNKSAFREYAHPHFAKGKAWSFEAIRRDVVMSQDGRLAWFDEDLATPNLGPARGSGVLRKIGAVWRIAHYNLSITVPNERFKDVKALLDGQPAEAEPKKVSVAGRVLFTGDEPLPMEVPKRRKNHEVCRDKAIRHNALRTHQLVDGQGYGLADVLVRLAVGSVASDSPLKPRQRLAARDCVFEPRMLAVQAGQEIEIVNLDATLANVHVRQGSQSVFNVGMPTGSGPIIQSLELPGIYRVGSSLHSWSRAFIAVSDHPFFAVTDANGAFSIAGIPDGEYVLEAWHSFMGKKTKTIRVTGGRVPIAVVFEYDGSEEEPRENKGELDDLF